MRSVTLVIPSETIWRARSLASISDRGCEDTLCGAYEYRADVYLKLHDYPHAISDLGHTIRNYLAGTIFGFNIRSGLRGHLVRGLRISRRRLFEPPRLSPCDQ